MWALLIQLHNFIENKDSCKDDILLLNNLSEIDNAHFESSSVYLGPKNIRNIYKTLEQIKS